MPMNAYPQKEHYTADDLLAILAILRDPENGCPWDKVQTHTSIRMNFLEEAYEAVDAIDLDDPELLCEELGDVLMQVGFHTQIEQEAGRFTWQQVCDGVCRKLIDRHPHIFGGDTSIKDWDALKNKEKGRVTLQDDLDSVPKALPALMRAAKLQKRAARGGVTVTTDPAELEPKPHWVSCCLKPPPWPVWLAWTPSRRCKRPTPPLPQPRANCKTRSIAGPGTPRVRSCFLLIIFWRYKP